MQVLCPFCSKEFENVLDLDLVRRKLNLFLLPLKNVFFLVCLNCGRYYLPFWMVNKLKLEGRFFNFFRVERSYKEQELLELKRVENHKPNFLTKFLTRILKRIIGRSSFFSQFFIPLQFFIPVQ